MTDNEIIKALEHCSSDEVGLCHICPLDGECNGDITILLKYALDLINRQKAEIERLKALSKHHQTLINMLNEGIAEAKAEAIKEFVKRLKEEEFASGVFGSSHCRKKIDYLVKEMIGE